MATNTTNYNLKKPAATDNYNVADQNSNTDLIDAALTPTADPVQVPTGSTGKLSQWVSWLTNRIKAITGGTNWYDAPATTLQAANTHANSTTAHSATSAATANRIMMRDANGRVKVAAPSAADDVARKDTVDALAGVGNTKTVKQVDDAVGQLAANMENIGDSVIVKSPTPPEGIVEGRLWLDESDNTYQGTIMEDYLAHKADYTAFKGNTNKFTADYEYQTATVVGSQIRLVRQGTSKRIPFKLTADVSGTITISLDGGATSKPLQDTSGNAITSMSKGFAEVIADATFFTLVEKGKKIDEEYLALIANSNSFGSMQVLTCLCIDDNYIYVGINRTNNHRVEQINKSTLITSDYGSLLNTPTAIITDANYVYAFAYGQVLRRFVKGNMSLVTEGPSSGYYASSVENVAIDNNNLFASNGTIVYKINKANLNLESQTVALATNEIKGICLDDIYIYAVGASVVRKYRKSDMVLIATSAPFSTELNTINIEGDYIYVGTGPTMYKRIYKLQKSDLTEKAGSASYITSAMYSFNSLQISDKKLYVLHNMTTGLENYIVVYDKVTFGMFRQSAKQSQTQQQVYDPNTKIIYVAGTDYAGVNGEGRIRLFKDVSTLK